MNTRYQIHSNINSADTNMNTIDVSMHAHNTRLQNRLSNLQENRTLNKDDINEFGPAFNTRHSFVNVVPTNTPSLKNELSVEIDFDEASREWNKNKRRVGQSYEYKRPVKVCWEEQPRYNTRSSKKSSS
jgi:hypothetical protein